MGELGRKHMNPLTANPTPTRKHRRYDEVFKRQAVEHWLLSGKSGRQIADELGVNQQTLNSWKKVFTQRASPAEVAGTLEQLQAENQRLKRELARAVQARDILKKTLGILSEPSEIVLNGSRP
jgi:transposase-like protein